MSTETKLETPIDHSAEGVVVHRLVRLLWPIRGRYCEFEMGDVVKLSRQGIHARLERLQWRNSLTISNVLSIEHYLIGYEDAPPNASDHPTASD